MRTRRTTAYLIGFGSLGLLFLVAPLGSSQGTGGHPVIDYDRAPKPTKTTRPRYPKAALDKRIEGTVTVEILIDAEGRVHPRRVLTSIPALDAAALETVKEWRFSPAIKDGQPVATTARAPIVFRIGPPAARIGPLFFDPEGVDFTAWINGFKNETYKNWTVPQSALMGSIGHADIEFTVERDGTLSSARLVEPTGEPALDKAAENALRLSKLPPLPPDFHPERVTMQVSFLYNEGPAAPAPARVAPTPSPLP